MFFFQYGYFCFCGNEIKILFNCVLDGECDMFCEENLDELCGGYWRIYIFMNEQIMYLCKMEIGEYIILYMNR